MSMENKSSQTATLLKVLSYIKKYKLYIILSLVTAAVTVASSLYIPILTGDAIDYIIGPGKVDYSAILKIIIEACVVMGITAISQIPISMQMVFSWDLHSFSQVFLQL